MLQMIKIVVQEILNLKLIKFVCIVSIDVSRVTLFDNELNVTF